MAPSLPRDASPSCAHCGRPIHGQFLRALDREWHPEHFLCAGCGKPFSGSVFVPRNSRPYHPPCHADLFAPQCFYCGTRMTGSYVRDAWGTEFCAAHAGQFSACLFCGRLVDGKCLTGASTEAGLQCAVCSQSAVHNSAMANSLFRSVTQWMRKLGLSVPEIPLRLTSCDALLAHGEHHSSGHPLGITRVVIILESGKALETRVTGIDILTALPSTLFRSVAAHEFGHAWLRTQQVKEIAAQEEEGFCELLSFVLLQDDSAPDAGFYARRIEANVDPVYGAGFRHVRKIADGWGMASLLSEIKLRRKLPPTLRK